MSAGYTVETYLDSENVRGRHPRKKKVSCVQRNYRECDDEGSGENVTREREERAGLMRHERDSGYIYIYMLYGCVARQDMMEAHVKSPDKGIRGRIGLAGGPRADRARPRISPIRSAQGPDASSYIIF